MTVARDFPALAGLLSALRTEAQADLLQAVELNRTDGFDMRAQVVGYLRLLDECEKELQVAGDCGADQGECICLCHLRGEVHA